jgi:hypothetical protein
MKRSTILAAIGFLASTSTFPIKASAPEVTALNAEGGTFLPFVLTEGPNRETANQMKGTFVPLYRGRLRPRELRLAPLPYG